MTEYLVFRVKKVQLCPEYKFLGGCECHLLFPPTTQSFVECWLNANVSTRDDNHELNLMKVQTMENDASDLMEAECECDSS